MKSQPMLLLLATLAAASPSDLLTRVARADGQYKDQASSAEMRLHRGSTILVRGLVVSVLQRPHDGHRIKLVFRTPADVEGTTLLTHLEATQEDQQWIFLPAFGKARKIAPSTQTAAFLGSDFSYEDLKMIVVSPDRFACEDRGVELREGAALRKLECVPRYAGSGYKSLAGWIDTTTLTVRAMDLTDLSGKLCKRLSSSGWARVDGHWRPATVRMDTPGKGTWTEFSWSGYRFGTGLSEREFEAASLR